MKQYPQESTMLSISISVKLVESDLQDLEPLKHSRIIAESYAKNEQSQRLFMYLPPFESCGKEPLV